MGRSSGHSGPVGAYVRLGRTGYEEALSLQRRLRNGRFDGKVGDVVLTVEHDPVFTIGRRGSLGNLRVAREALDSEGIHVCEVERGGDMTYHGPGQLVVYPILDLRRYGRDLRRYVERLEETAIRTLGAFGIAAGRESGRPGVWTKKGKIASVGVHVRHWITLHGIALNVDVNRAHFGMIRPCGLDVEVVSLSDLLGRPVELYDVEKRFMKEAARLFRWTLERIDREALMRRLDETGA